MNKRLELSNSNQENYKDNSHCIKLGARRIESTFIEDLSSVSFENPDKSIILVVQSENDYDIVFSVDVKGYKHSENAKSHSIMTLVINL